MYIPMEDCGGRRTGSLSAASAASCAASLASSFFSQKGSAISLLSVRNLFFLFDRRDFAIFAAFSQSRSDLSRFFPPRSKISRVLERDALGIHERICIGLQAYFGLSTANFAAQYKRNFECSSSCLDWTGLTNPQEAISPMKQMLVTSHVLNQRGSNASLFCAFTMSLILKTLII